MADSDQNYKKHFILQGVTETERFSPPRPNIDPPQIPDRNRQEHSALLRTQIDTIKPLMIAARDAQRASGIEEGFGLQVEFSSFPDIELAFESLARERSGIELLNVRHLDNCTLATILVPDGKLAHFEKLIQDYLEEKRDSRNIPRDNRKLINAIKEIRAASIRALWTDDGAVFPTSLDEIFWWEVWLPIFGDRSATNSTFRTLAEAQGMRVAPGELYFPERTVLLAYTSSRQMQNSMITINSIAELRRAKETADFFDSQPPGEQPAWVQEVLSRTQYAGHSAQVPYVCLLDTGVNNGHPLISPALANVDLHTVEPAWGTNDAEGHGTAMAGLALLGNLTDALVTNDAIEIAHRIESVKLLDQNSGNGGDAIHHGYLTVEAVSRPEVTDPNRSRVFGLAITARDNRDRGRPSAWSAAVDRLVADVDGDNATPRLMIISAGNINDSNAWTTYPHSNATDGIHDPAQAWNALTVGAYTRLVHITEPNTVAFQPIAPDGGLSPFSTTSLTWLNSHWPIKPDVVFEGGNAAKDTLSAVTMASLSLLTTHHVPSQRMFTTTNATSAATALGARMAAQLMAEYPQLRPETIRALMVHSAEWTDAMKNMFLPTRRQPTKTEYMNLLRHCGFGVPNLERALWSVSNSLTMLVEESLHPFMRIDGKQPTLKDMNLHRLPWPLTELESLGEVQIEMRVTLSYFIEPNPSERGIRSRYRYESHGLRFDVKRPLETEDDFRTRINVVARDEEEEGVRSTGDDPNWIIGTKGRHRGSLHSDIWRGTAAELASRGVLAVYPTLGWWRTRTKLARYDKSARYSLVISIHAPEVDIDLYTAVANQIAVPVIIQQ